MDHLISRLVELTATTPAAEFHGLPQFLANTDPDQVDNRFGRADARDFYTRHNPVEVVVESILDDITFYPFAELDARQVGYAPRTISAETAHRSRSSETEANASGASVVTHRLD